MYRFYRIKELIYPVFPNCETDLGEMESSRDTLTATAEWLLPKRQALSGKAASVRLLIAVQRGLEEFGLAVGAI